MSNNSLISFIEEYENKFVVIKKRFYYLENIFKELDETTEGFMFNIRGDVVYQMLRDSYSMLVIDLASIARGMIRKKGFFRKLPSYIPQLKVPSKKSVSKSCLASHGYKDLYLEAEILKYSLQAYERLFPDVLVQNRRNPNHEDIRKLKDRFHSICESIIDDRDRNRAHKYELPEQGKEPVKLLTILDLEKKFQKIEELMNDLRMVCSYTSYSSNDLNFSNSDRLAENIVDMILLGDHNTINIAFGISQDMKDSFGIYPYEYREEYYSVLKDNYKKMLRTRNEEEGRKFREEHQDYSKIELPDLPINFKIYIN
ncbi:hypothetical protein [Halobacteriovorax sp. ZH1_bin.1]|uniref:hypothetical protein n=1 Tax=Halobacteriovorax sp. ZH1_bin.1 TaxID=3157723 RepID=UPI003713E447